MCALVYGKSSPDVPEAMFTGDVLFVGSMGRPDLLEGSISAAWLASAAYDSWFNKISKLGDNVSFFPAHGAGSLCGAHLSDEPFSTIGKEKATNPYFKYTRRGDFIAALLEGLQDAPQYFRHNARINREGPPTGFACTGRCSRHHSPGAGARRNPQNRAQPISPENRSGCRSPYPLRPFSP